MVVNNPVEIFDEFIFAEAVSEHPCMYDLANKNYYSCDTRSIIFRRVGTCFGLNGEHF